LAQALRHVVERAPFEEVGRIAQLTGTKTLMEVSGKHLILPLERFQANLERAQLLTGSCVLQREDFV